MNKRREKGWRSAMALDNDNAFFTQFGGQELTIIMAISTGRTPSEAGIIEKRWREGETSRIETWCPIMISNGPETRRAGGER